MYLVGNVRVLPMVQTSQLSTDRASHEIGRVWEYCYIHSCALMLTPVHLILSADMLVSWRSRNTHMSRIEP